MNNPRENIYSKKYLNNSRLVSPKQKGSWRRCRNNEESVGTLGEDESAVSLVNPRSQSEQSSCLSQNSPLVTENNVESSKLDHSKSKKHSLNEDDNVVNGYSAKKVKLNCLELEEVNDTGQCFDSASDEAPDNSDEDKHEEINEDMETFNDLSDNIYQSNNYKWLAKVVSHDHDYFGSRVRFSGVTVWYFPRHQYGCGVPSVGDVGLGMEMSHVHTEHHHIDNLDTQYKISYSKQKVRRKTKPLKPLSLSARLSLLRSHGIYHIDRRESKVIEKLQESRAGECGCDCVSECLPHSCACAINQVGCEVDSEGFPCKCSNINCQNPQGRRVFNRKEVDMHRWNQVDFNSSKLSRSSSPTHSDES